MKYFQELIERCAMKYPHFEDTNGQETLRLAVDEVETMHANLILEKMDNQTNRRVISELESIICDLEAENESLKQENNYGEYGG